MVTDIALFKLRMNCCPLPLSFCWKVPVWSSNLIYINSLSLSFPVQMHAIAFLFIHPY